MNDWLESRSANTHVVVKTEVPAVRVSVSVSVAVETTTSVAVVMGTVAPVAEEPLGSIVHCVGRPLEPTVIVCGVPFETPELVSPDCGSR